MCFFKKRNREEETIDEIIEKNKQKKLNTLKVKEVIVHIHQTDEMGNLIKIGEVKGKLKKKDDDSIIVRFLGTEQVVDMEKLEHRIDGRKELNVIWLGPRTFKALSPKYLTKKLFETGDVNKLKEDALVFSPMPIDEKQIYINTLKWVLNRRLGFFEKYGVLLLTFLICIVMMVFLYYFADNYINSMNNLANIFANISRDLKTIASSNIVQTIPPA